MLSLPAGFTVTYFHSCFALALCEQQGSAWRDCLSKQALTYERLPSETSVAAVTVLSAYLPLRNDTCCVGNRFGSGFLKPETSSNQLVHKGNPVFMEASCIDGTLCIEMQINVY